MTNTKLSTQPYKGTRDYYPEDMAKRDYLFNIWRTTAKEFGYEEYDNPILENAEIYRAKSGDELANTQLYNFVDKGGREVAIKPEMTPSLARMIAAKFPELPKPIRWFSIDKFYRYEKPQRGRTREFFQLNFDIFGISEMSAEIEIFKFIDTVMKKVKAPEGSWKVYANNRYLMDYIFKNVIKINEDMIPKVARAIDNYPKVKPDEYPAYLEEVGLDKLQAAKVIDFLNTDIKGLEKYKEESRGAKELLKLFEMCKEVGLDNFEFQPYIMRGITYYTGTVIEMFDTEGDKNPRALFGGGRYDDLLEIFGKEKLPAFGIGWGNIPMQDFMETYNLYPEFKSDVDVFITLNDEKYLTESFKLAGDMRKEGKKVEMQLVPQDLKKQLGYASKKGIKWVIIKDNDGGWLVKDMVKGIQEKM